MEGAAITERIVRRFHKFTKTMARLAGSSFFVIVMAHGSREILRTFLRKVLGG